MEDDTGLHKHAVPVHFVTEGPIIPTKYTLVYEELS